MKKQVGTLKTVKRISVYGSAYELLQESDLLPEGVQNDTDFCDYMRCCDDYDCIGYFCINDSTIICTDNINGDVISVCSADELLTGLREQYEEYYK